MFGSAASTVAHGVEDYVSEEERLKALEKARRLESMLKRDQQEWEQGMEETKLTRQQMKDRAELEADQRELRDKDLADKRGRMALAMFANPEDYYGAEGTQPGMAPVAPAPYGTVGTDQNMPWNRPQEVTQSTVQSRELPDDPLSRKLMIASDADLGLDQTKQFLAATQQPRDFAGELEARLRSQEIIQQRHDAVRKYAVDHPRPIAGSSSKEVPIPQTKQEYESLLASYNAQLEQGLSVNAGKSKRRDFPANDAPFFANASKTLRALTSSPYYRETDLPTSREVE